MNRTPYKVILPKRITFIPLEGINRLEYDIESERIVSYLTEEEYNCQLSGEKPLFYCPLLEEPGIIDHEWMKNFKKISVSDIQKICDRPQIIPHIAVVYVRWRDQIIGKFYSYDSENVVFSQKGAISYAEILVEQLINNEL